jgi:lactoylglutathione lyase
MPIPGLQQIAHWALKVFDLDRSLKFYRDTLGFKEMMRLYHDNGDTWLVYLRLTDTQFVELFTNGIGSDAPDEDTTAMNHICLQVESIADVAAHFNKIGIPLMRQATLGLDGNNQCWIQDPDGNRIEFMQMLPGNMQEVAIKRLNG